MQHLLCLWPSARRTRASFCSHASLAPLAPVDPATAVRISGPSVEPCLTALRPLDTGTTLELTADEERRLAAALGTTPNADTFSGRVQQLQAFALRELIDWAIARRRFESVSAIDVHRILTIFGEIREEAPTVELLANQLSISESRAVALLSRMRYGDARLIRRLTYLAARRDLDVQLASAAAMAGRKVVWVKSDTGRIVDEANTAIMIDQVGRADGGQHEGAEKAERTDSTRTGQSWTASEKMWGFILAWIEAQAKTLAPDDGE